MRSLSAFILVTALAGCAPPKVTPSEDLSNCPDGCVDGTGPDATCNNTCAVGIKCTLLIDSICEATSAACETPFNDCKNVFVQAFPCGDIKTVGPSFDECISDLERVTQCGEEVPLSCPGALLREAGTAESCSDMAARWVCSGQGERAACVDVPNPETDFAIPSCVCAPGRVRDAAGRCIQSCDAILDITLCASTNASPFCDNQTSKPICRCNEGFVGDGTQCDETCAHDLASDPPDNCERLYGEHWIGLCAGEFTDPYVCGCEDGYVQLDDLFNGAPTDTICVLECCVDTQPYFVCSDTAGVPDPNCSCTCNGIARPEDRPRCLCNPGFTYNAAQDSCL